MSSNVDSTYLSGADLDYLHGILAEAGYSGDSDTARQLRSSGVAANLLIRLFQEGVTERAELVVQLEHRFGRFVQVHKSAVSPFHRYAIQGLPVKQRMGRVQLAPAKVAAH
jgi:hypothetical protein